MNVPRAYIIVTNQNLAARLIEAEFEYFVLSEAPLEIYFPVSARVCADRIRHGQRLPAIGSEAKRFFPGKNEVEVEAREKRQARRNGT